MATPATGSITGTITDTTSAPLANVCAYAWGTHGENTQNAGATTNAEGDYDITGLSPGNYIVFFQSCNDSSYGIVYYNGTPTGTSGYREATDVVVASGETTSNINAEIAVAGSISGTVTDDSNTPLAGICVIATGSNGGGNATVTVQDGSYTITGLPSDQYTVEFTSQSVRDCGNTGNYGDQYYNDTVAGAPSSTTATPISIESGSVVTGVNAVMTAGGSISGTITDIQGDPLSSICVEAIGSAGEVVATPAYQSNNPAGSYVISNLYPDTYVVEFFDCSANPQYPTQYYDGSIGGSPNAAAASPVEVAANSTETSIDATMSLLTLQTIHFKSVAPPAVVLGQTYNVAATGGASGNPVTFSIDATSTPDACTLSGSTVSFVSVGTCVIDANQAGTAVFAAAEEARQSILVVTALTIQQPLQVLSIDGGHNTAQLFTTGGSGTGEVTYLVSNGSENGCTVTGHVLSAPSPGTCIVTATKAASFTYAAITSAPTVVALSVVPVASWRVTGFSGIIRGGKASVVTIKGTGDFSESSVVPVHGMTFKILKHSNSSLQLRVKAAVNVKPGVYALTLRDSVGASTKVYVVMSRARHSKVTVGRLRLTR